MNIRFLLALTVLLLVVNLTRADDELKNKVNDEGEEGSFYDAQTEFEAEPTITDDEMAFLDTSYNSLLEEFGVCGWSKGFYDCEECCENQAFANFQWKDGDCKCL